MLYLNHAIVNPPIDRQAPPEDVRDIAVHCEKETDAGIIVSGAKVVATNSALTNANFIGFYGPTPLSSPDMAIFAMVPMDSPGVKLICRTSYELTSAVMGSPFDYPLSSRLDENDSILIQPMNDDVSAAGTGNDVRPMTGDEYLESLRDGREIYIYGERVKDVTTHPAFRNTARMVARLYDALHDPETKDTLTVPTDTGNGGSTFKFFRVGRSSEDIVSDRDAIAAWARMNYGWMGRSPDYKAAFTGTLGANHAFYGDYSKNAQAFLPDFV